MALYYRRAQQRALEKGFNVSQTASVWGKGENMTKVTISENLRKSILALVKSEEGKKVVNVAIDAFNHMTAINGTEVVIDDVNDFHMYAIEHNLLVFKSCEEWVLHGYTRTTFRCYLYWGGDHCIIQLEKGYRIHISSGSVYILKNRLDIAKV